MLHHLFLHLRHTPRKPVDIGLVGRGNEFQRPLLRRISQVFNGCRRSRFTWHEALARTACPSFCTRIFKILQIARIRITSRQALLGHKKKRSHSSLGTVPVVCCCGSISRSMMLLARVLIVSSSPAYALAAVFLLFFLIKEMHSSVRISTNNMIFDLTASSSYTSTY